MEDLLYFSFNEKSGVLLIFFFNAMVFSLLLVRHGIRQQKQSSKWLAMFVFLGGLYLGPFLFGYAGWYNKKLRIYREFLFFTPLQQLFLIGPVLYFYCKSLLNTQFTITKKHLLHFVPAVGYLLYSLLVFITDKLILDTFYFYADGRDKDLAFWYQMLGLISMLFYLLLSLRSYQQYRIKILNEVSYANAILLQWIRYFLIAFTIILVLRVVFFVLNPEWGQFGSKYWYYLCVAILFFGIALAGYTHAIKTTSYISLTYSENTTRKELSTPKNNMTPEAMEQWKSKLQGFIVTKKAYVNPRLTLTEVAEHLATNRNVISQVINQGFQMNFNDYINAKRIEVVIHKLEQGEHHNKTLLGIALECGFNSKPTFNRAFKKHKKTTPKAFIENLYP